MNRKCLSVLAERVAAAQREEVAKYSEEEIDRILASENNSFGANP